MTTFTRQGDVVCGDLLNLYNFSNMRSYLEPKPVTKMYLHDTVAYYVTSGIEPSIDESIEIVKIILSLISPGLVDGTSLSTIGRKSAESKLDCTIAVYTKTHTYELVKYKGDNFHTIHMTVPSTLLHMTDTDIGLKVAAYKMKLSPVEAMKLACRNSTTSSLDANGECTTTILTWGDNA